MNRIAEETLINMLTWLVRHGWIHSIDLLFKLLIEEEIHQGWKHLKFLTMLMRNNLKWIWQDVKWPYHSFGSWLHEICGIWGDWGICGDWGIALRVCVIWGVCGVRGAWVRAWGDVIVMRFLIICYLRCLRCQRCLSQGLGRCDSNESICYLRGLSCQGCLSLDRCDSNESLIIRHLRCQRCLSQGLGRSSFQIIYSIFLLFT